MTDREELGMYFRRLSKSIDCLIEVRHHVLALGTLCPECKHDLPAIDSLTQEALQNIAWVNARISMECYHLDGKD